MTQKVDNSTRLTTQEITRASNGLLLVCTWEWNNGFNLIDTRRATEAECRQYELANGGKSDLPVTLRTEVKDGH